MRILIEINSVVSEMKDADRWTTECPSSLWVHFEHFLQRTQQQPKRTLMTQEVVCTINRSSEPSGYLVT
jgi:hypothetical protein